MKFKKKWIQAKREAQRIPRKKVKGNLDTVYVIG